MISNLKFYIATALPLGSDYLDMDDLGHVTLTTIALKTGLPAEGYAIRGHVIVRDLKKKLCM